VHDLAHWLDRVSSELNEAGARYAVIGGLAVGARHEARFTRDIDLAVSVASDSDAETILGQLIRAGFCPLAELDNTRTQRLATMRLLPPGIAPDADTGEAILVDLIFDSCGIEPEVVRDATTLEVFPGLRLPVARRAHLIAMKLVSVGRRRRRDQADLQALVESATPVDLARVRELIRLITERGYHRGRDLGAMLDEYIRDSGPRA
jgi:hypothetical protein